MKTLTVKLKLLSDALIASGEGHGAIVDSDVLFDDLGLPYIPGRRFKGCLREAAREVQMMLNASGLALDFDIDQTFGNPGQLDTPEVSFSGLYPPDYQASREWLEYLKSEIGHQEVIETLASIRYQIAIEDQGEFEGVTKDHSLRTIRVLNKGFVFEGQITVPDDKSLLNTLVLACQQLEDIGIGAKRKRGLGRVICELWDNNTLLNQTILKEAFANV